MTDKRANLAILAAGLSALPENYQGFEMSDFFDVVNKYGDDKTDLTYDQMIAAIEKAREIEQDYARNNGGVARCGAVACAVGHAPTISKDFLAIDSDFNTNGTVNWTMYTLRLFLDRIGDDFSWMFGGKWSDYDNTPHGAAKRIRYYLAHGLPDGFDEDEDYEDYVGLYADA